MAKQAEDKMTRDMYMATPGRRGRPPKEGGAMTAAERKRAQRARDKTEKRSIESLLSELSKSITNGQGERTKKLCSRLTGISQEVEATGNSAKEVIAAWAKDGMFDFL